MVKANNHNREKPRKHRHITLAKLGYDPKMARLMNREKKHGKKKNH